MGDGMEVAAIRAHSASNTLIISRNSNCARLIDHRVNLIVGLNARCIEGVHIDGNLELGKRARVIGNVKAKDVVLGPWSLIKGDLTVEGDLLALDNCMVTGKVKCGGSAVIRPGVCFGSIDAAGLIEVFGKNPSRYTRGRMVSKKEDK